MSVKSLTTDDAGDDCLGVREIGTEKSYEGICRALEREEIPQYNAELQKVI